jgi:hypothetical protein
MAMPLRRALSLKALIAWVRNSGRKLRLFSRASWLSSLMSLGNLAERGDDSDVFRNMSDLRRIIKG